MNLRKTLGRHSHWTHDEEVTGGGGLREIEAAGPVVNKEGLFPALGLNREVPGAYLLQRDD